MFEFMIMRSQHHSTAASTNLYLNINSYFFNTNSNNTAYLYSAAEYDVACGVWLVW